MPSMQRKDLIREATKQILLALVCCPRYKRRATTWSSRRKDRVCNQCKESFNGRTLKCPKCIESGTPWENLTTDQSRRRRLLCSRPHQCSLCGLTNWRELPTPLVMDHINGDSDDNRQTNLRLICPNCDAQLPTFGARNKGNGRLSRRLTRKVQKGKYGFYT